MREYRTRILEKFRMMNFFLPGQTFNLSVSDQVISIFFMNIQRLLSILCED